MGVQQRVIIIRIECAKIKTLEAIASCLLSAGSLLGSRRLCAVIKIGLKTIQRFEGYVELKVVCIFACYEQEAETLN